MFYLRVRVPDRLKVRIGMLEVRRSLKVYSVSQARRLASKYAARVLEAFEMIEHHRIPTDRSRALIQGCFFEIAPEAERFCPETTEPELEVAEQRHLSTERLRALETQLHNGVFDGEVIWRANKLARCEAVSLDDLDRANARDIMSGVARALIEQQRLFMFRLDERLATYTPTDQLFKEVAPPLLKAEAGHVGDAGVGATVEEVVTAYIAAKAHAWAPKTVVTRKRQLAYMEEFFGSATKVSELTPKDFVAFSEAVSKLRLSHHIGPVKSFAGRQTTDPAHRISAKTASLIFEGCKGAMNWACNKKHMIEVNPATSVTIDSGPKKTKGKKPRRPFTPSELNLVFSAPLYTGHHSVKARFAAGGMVNSDARYWVPLVSFYTGMRLGEIIQLQFADVKLIGDIPHISVTELDGGKLGSGEEKYVKSDAGIRLVPLHPDLMQLGFAEFVARRRKQQAGKGRLFFEVKYGADGMPSSVFSKWFGRFLTSVGLTDRSLVFHSFRHNMKDALRNAMLPSYVIDQIIGHADEADKKNGEYGEGNSLKVLYDAIKAVQPVIDLPLLLKGFKPQPL